MSVKLINADDFNEEIKKDLVLIDFFAKWCGPCKMFSPILDELSNEIDYCSFLKVDVDESNELALSLGVLSIPTLMIFKNGKLVDKRVGFQNKEELKKFIESNQ